MKGFLHVKLSSLLPSAAIAMLSAAAFTVAQPAQDQQNPPAESGQPQQGAPPGGQMGRMRNFPPPTNLKVLPKDLTGSQVRDIMEKRAVCPGRALRARAIWPTRTTLGPTAGHG